ncbi:rhomboid-like protein [Actinocorallia longicatena]|uniref:Integral membrane protein n=1 Tax=Actinocorallia longicatena TaxID=111803 RepID=A0ABP6QCC2_9ACTN
MIIGGLVLVIAWYLLRLLATRWRAARRLVERLSPYTRRLHAWVLSAPATFGYVAVFTAFTLVQRSAPSELVGLLTRLSSTNLFELHRAPVRALAQSALWVADGGWGLILYVVVFATVVAYAERRYGTPRIILICVTGHVLGSILTARVELWAIRTGRAPAALALVIDVGVSYMMVAGCAAALLVATGRFRLLIAAGLLVGVVLPMVGEHSIWNLGHLFATLSGLSTAALTLAFARPRPAVPSADPLI